LCSRRCGDGGAYAFWRDGIGIDLGDDPHSSDDGIHAAATGAIWSGVIQGFAGLQIVEGELHLAPKLPAHWRKLAFPLRWRTQRLHFTFENDVLTIETTAPVTLTLWEKRYAYRSGRRCPVRTFLRLLMGPLPRRGAMTLKAVVFDLDGVITDTAHLHFLAWRSVAEEIGITFDEVFNEQLKGISRMDSLQRILKHGGKEGTFSDKQCLALATKKNALYVQSLASLTEDSLLPGIRRCWRTFGRRRSKLGSPPFPSMLLEYCTPWAFIAPSIFAPMLPVSPFKTGPGDLPRRLCRPERPPRGGHWGRRCARGRGGDQRGGHAVGRDWLRPEPCGITASFNAGTDLEMPDRFLGLPAY
jgi:hypothetical protein